MVVAQPPWHAQAANLVMDLHAISRELETRMLTCLSERSRHIRGGSDANTKAALLTLPNLAEGVDDEMAAETLSALSRWVIRAEVALELVEPLRRVPTQPGESEMRCPWCRYMTIRWRMLTTSVHCVNPGCHYGPDDLRRPRGHLDHDPLTDGVIITWQVEPLDPTDEQRP